MDIDKYKLRELVTEWSREERERERDIVREGKTKREEENMSGEEYFPIPLIFQ